MRPARLLDWLVYLATVQFFNDRVLFAGNVAMDADCCCDVVEHTCASCNGCCWEDAMEMDVSWTINDTDTANCCCPEYFSGSARLFKSSSCGFDSANIVADDCEDQECDYDVHLLRLTNDQWNFNITFGNSIAFEGENDLSDPIKGCCGFSSRTFEAVTSSPCVSSSSGVPAATVSMTIVENRCCVEVDSSSETCTAVSTDYSNNCTETIGDPDPICEEAP